MHNPIVLIDIAFITNITNYLNKMNAKLQVQPLNIGNYFCRFTGFKNKLNFLKSKLADILFIFIIVAKTFLLIKK